MVNSLSSIIAGGAQPLALCVKGSKSIYNFNRWQSSFGGKPSLLLFQCRVDD